MLGEVDGGIVTRYQILEHPTEHGQAIDAVAHHQAIFEYPPGLVAGDRGVQSAETEERLNVAGVKCVAIAAAGKLSEERQPWSGLVAGGVVIAGVRASRAALPV